MQASAQRIRLALDITQLGALQDLISSSTPQFPNATDVQFELAFFFGSTLLDVSNLDSVTLDVKNAGDRDGLPVMSETINSASLNNALTLSAWQGGNPTDCHALLTFTNEQTSLGVTADTNPFWLVVSALTNDSPARQLDFGFGSINVLLAGQGVAPPSYVVTPMYYTAAQSDARYSRTVDLTSLNAAIATLNSEMTTVTSTANAALPKAGGTLTGALTITGLSGILLATSGLISGSATTSSLPEGSNLYWTQARFNTALAAVSGAASGVCPLDTNALIPTAYLPSITVHNTFVVSSQAAMLALAAHQGDVAIRTDVNESFILTNNTPATLSNWSQLLTPTSAVTSVNSQTGAVTLTTSNITEGSNLYFTNARAQAQALAATLTGFSNATGGNVTAGDSILTALGRLEYRMELNDVKTTGATCLPLAGGTLTGNLQFSGAIAGVVLSNLTDTQRAGLSPVNGMLIYDATLSALMLYNGQWQQIALGGGSTWYNGSGAPGTIGSSGSYYLDYSSGKIYFNTSGAWAVIYAPAASNLGGAYSTSITGGNLNYLNGSSIIATLTSVGGWSVSGGFYTTNGYFTGSPGSASPVCDSNGYLYTSSYTPTGSSYSGTVHQLAHDANYFYVCVATNSWKRAALSAF